MAVRLETQIAQPSPYVLRGFVVYPAEGQNESRFVGVNTNRKNLNSGEFSYRRVSLSQPELRVATRALDLSTRRS